MTTTATTSSVEFVQGQEDVERSDGSGSFTVESVAVTTRRDSEAEEHVFVDAKAYHSDKGDHIGVSLHANYQGERAREVTVYDLDGVFSIRIGDVTMFVDPASFQALRQAMRGVGNEPCPGGG